MSCCSNESAIWPNELAVIVNNVSVLQYGYLFHEFTKFYFNEKIVDNF